MRNHQQFSRRGFIAGSAGLAASWSVPVAADPDTVASGTAVHRYTIGATSPVGVERAQTLAEEVIKTFEMEEETVVVGRYTQSAVDTLRARDDIAYVERDGVYRVPKPVPAPDKTPVNTDAPDGTPPDGTATEVRSEQVLSWGHDLLGCRHLHAEGVTGQGVSVGVIDSGIAEFRPDFEGAVIEKRSFVSDHNPEDWHDQMGHGTAVAGIIGARDNKRGIVGVAPESDLYIAQVFGPPGHWSDIAEATNWCVEQEVDIINFSIEGAYSFLIRRAIRSALQNDIIVVAASGNDGCHDCITYPAAYEGVVSVGALVTYDELAVYTSTGPELDIVAPGSYVQTTSLDGGLRSFRGTSAAAPYVAGAAALLLSDGVPPENVVSTLQDVAVDIDLSTPQQGAGRVDAWGAINGKQRIRLVNTEPGAISGHYSDFDIWVRANTAKDMDWGSPPDPYFQVRLPGHRVGENTEWVVILETEEIGVNFDTHFSLNVPTDELRRIEEPGAIPISVRLFDGDSFLFVDDLMEEWTIQGFKYAPPPSDGEIPGSTGSPTSSPTVATTDSGISSATPVPTPIDEEPTAVPTTASESLHFPRSGTTEQPSVTTSPSVTEMNTNTSRDTVFDQVLDFLQSLV